MVDSKSQGKGIGRMLLAASQNLYRQADFITLSTRTFNEKAIGFYKYLGFYETEKTPKIAYILRPNVKNNPHIVCLEKKIRE